MEISSEMLTDNSNIYIKNDQECEIDQTTHNPFFDYLISDTPTGRYFTCFSLNKRTVSNILSIIIINFFLSIIGFCYSELAYIF
jgi:hypothetical protein